MTKKIGRPSLIAATGGVLAHLRASCLSLPETSERASWGHPNFRAGKKTFAAFERVHGRPSIAFRLDRADVARLVRRPGFFATPYGRGLWVSLWVEAPMDWPFIDDLLRRSYRVVALKRMLAALDASPVERASRAKEETDRPRPPRS